VKRARATSRDWRTRARTRLGRLWAEMPRPDTTSEIELEELDGARIVVLPGVFNGIRHHTGAFLARTLDAALVPAEGSVLDLGTGSGVVALFAARWAKRVVATDINPEAARCARINALAHHLEGVIETRTGDLFAPVREERFALILFNPPYFRGVPASPADQALRSPDTFERFLAELPRHLEPGGRALVVLSPDTDREDSLSTAPRLSVTQLRAHRILDKTLRVFAVRPR